VFVDYTLIKAIRKAKYADQCGPVKQVVDVPMHLLFAAPMAGQTLAKIPFGAPGIDIIALFKRDAAQRSDGDTFFCIKM